MACRAQGEARAQQLDAKLAEEPWDEVARFAAYSAQIESLGLMPWQQPPCHASLSDLSLPFGDTRAARESAELLKKLLDLGLSRYEADPMRAIIEAEARR